MQETAFRHERSVGHTEVSCSGRQSREGVSSLDARRADPLGDKVVQVILAEKDELVEVLPLNALDPAFSERVRIDRSRADCAGNVIRELLSVTFEQRSETHRSSAAEPKPVALLIAFGGLWCSSLQLRPLSSSTSDYSRRGGRKRCSAHRRCRQQRIIEPPRTARARKGSDSGTSHKGPFPPI